MLMMLLLQAVAPQATLIDTPQRAQATMRVLGDRAGCADRPLQASDPTPPGSGLMWREGGESVGLYRLLDRRIDGCPAPIIVNYRTPGSNAVGRETGRRPTPVITRRP
jgi:hypothetical protein